MAVKLIDLFGVTVTAGLLIFPVLYILGDLFAEVYGYDKTKRIITLGLLCNLTFVVIIQLAIALPPSSIWELQESFSLVLNSTFRLFFAGIISLFVGSNLNAYVLCRLKNKTNNKYLWARSILSTIVGEFVDTVIFITVSFYGVIDTQNLIVMILSQFTLKTLYEIIFTPVLCYIVKLIKRKEGIELYETTLNN